MQSVFDHRAFDDHEQVIFCSDAVAGLRAVIAVHRSGPGHALGGTRILPCPNMDAAVGDVLQLSRTMTYEAAMADLPYGGAKAVVIAEPTTVTPELLLAMGRAIDRLDGRFVTGEDVNVGLAEIEVMRGATRFLVGSRGAGSSEPAARGVFAGIRAAVNHRLGRDDLAGVSVAVQGLGQVGSAVARLLAAAGTTLVVADVRDEAVRRAVAEFSAVAVGADAIVDADVDVFAPCAIGGVLNRVALDRLRATIVAGAANNPLAGPRIDRLLRERGVLYAPDFVINAGGLINNVMHLEHYDRARVLERCDRINDTLTSVFRRAEADQVSTGYAAERVAEERMADRRS